MTLNLPFSSDTEIRLRELAAVSGQDVEAIVLQAVAEKLALAEAERSPTLQNGDHWKRKLRECIDLHPVATHFVDDSRDSIYAGRGE
jgi:hypothetical protein